VSLFGEVKRQRKRRIRERERGGKEIRFFCKMVKLQGTRLDKGSLSLLIDRLQIQRLSICQQRQLGIHSFVIHSLFPKAALIMIIFCRSSIFGLSCGGMVVPRQTEVCIELAAGISNHSNMSSGQVEIQQATRIQQLLPMGFFQ
jgi:hypothetical protein